MNQYFFEELGFRGDDQSFYDPRNSYLNEVLERRLGIPVTLAVIYIELGRGAGLDLVGVGFPGHFLVRTRNGSPRVIDPFNAGAELSHDDIEDRLRRFGDAAPDEETALEPVSNRSLLKRLLLNLKPVYLELGELERAIGVIERVLLLEPDDAVELRDLGALYGRLGRYDAGIRALESLRERVQDEEALSMLDEQIQGLRYWIGRMN